MGFIHKIKKQTAKHNVVDSHILPQHPIVDELEEHDIYLLQTEVEKLKKEVEELKAENSRLTTSNKILRNSLTSWIEKKGN